MGSDQLKEEKVVGVPFGKNLKITVTTKNGQEPGIYLPYYIIDNTNRGKPILLNSN